MDLINTLDNELKEKHLSDLEKMRYIYLRFCELFHFDSKWSAADIIEDKKLEDSIFYRKIDLENIDDFSIICRSGAYEVISPLIRELTNLHTNIISLGNHFYTEVTDDYNNRWKLDPMYGDMPRVKLGILPTGMYYVKKRGVRLEEYDFDFRYMDPDLGYRFIKRSEYETKIMSPSQYGAAKEVGELLDTTKVNKHFTDASYFIHIFPQLMSIPFEDIVDKDLVFHRIVNIEDECIQFELTKEKGLYTFKKITPERYEEVAKRLVYR
ncbi:MAG: hypothetical protein IKE10_01255 [Bacilli bacterium]|nr:hypothetical protein [Bacilli bacterium]